MKTREEYQKFVDELKDLCIRHGIGVIGTCEDEGVFGEIQLVDCDDYFRKSNMMDESELDGTICNMGVQALLTESNDDYCIAGYVPPNQNEQ